MDDGSGTIQINGVHTFAKAGTFQTVVNVEEFPTRHPHQTTEIGQGRRGECCAKPHAISLKGTLTGSYTTPLGNPDARSYDFTGTGSAGAMGAVDATGSITPPGFIKSGAATGEFTLTSTSPTGGTMTFDVTGHTQNGGSPLPEKLGYQIVSGTGTFARVKGKGTISVAIDTTASTFILVIH